ncbi:MAG: hypothetical protein PHV66_00205 [Bacteroidales bacterium]|nr:hypothetical protein [Bacteroidales bacterium]
MTLEFGNIVKIFLTNQVEKIENGIVTPVTGQSPIVVHASDFNVIPEVTNSKASLLTTTNLSLYIDKLTNTHASFFRIRRSVIIQASQSDNKSIVLGSLQYPARLILSRNINQDILKIEHKQPTNL